MVEEQAGGSDLIRKTLILGNEYAHVVKLVDTLSSGGSALGRGGSNPLMRTIFSKSPDMYRGKEPAGRAGIQVMAYFSLWSLGGGAQVLSWL